MEPILLQPPTLGLADKRIIDSLDRPRQKPMRILVLGMCRTGTTSLCHALRHLGYTPHHMRNLLVSPKEIAYWQEAADTTLLRPLEKQHLPPYTRPDFDKLLADYDVVTDLPGAVFASQLIEAYPEAKVILTLRDYDSWEQSMNATIYPFLNWELLAFCRVLNLTRMAPIMRLLHSLFEAYSDNIYGGPRARAAYEKHYDTVRSLVPSSNLLEFGPDFEWEPLCNFLGHEVPTKVAYPHTNDTAAMQKMITGVWWGVLRYFALIILGPIFLTAAGVGVYSYREEIWGAVQGLLGVVEPYARMKEEL